MVLPCIAAALNSIGGRCFGWISTEAAHIISYDDNIENLRKQVQDLDDATKSVENRIQEAANDRGETLVDPVIDRLLERMTTVKHEASKIIIEDERSSDCMCTCIIRLRLNMYACYLRSKSAKRAIDEATDLLKREKKHERPVANTDYLNCSSVTPILDFEEFESRMHVANQIMAALKDPNVNMVGVYGMGGAGKTTLAEKIGAYLKEDGTFSYVVLATVSEKQSQHQNNFLPNMLNIQKHIAGGLKIKLQGEDLRDRAAQLRKHLEKRDKVLIILDDIWSRFELKDVGIPIDSADKKFKILMTSRDEMVLRKQMGSRRNFGLDSLSLPDAWILFNKMVGCDSVYKKWRPVAEQVVKRCGGIPILLVSIARTLKDEDLKTWEDAVTQLIQFDGMDIVKDSYKVIEVSYKFLENEEIKKLLLLCAQLNHRAIANDDLLKYAMGLNIFQKCKKLKEVSNRLHKYLRSLKGCCLLQDGSEEGIIKMHDVVHKFATYVASRDHHVFSVANDDELQDWPSKDEFENFSAISLPYGHHHMLPAAFDNPKLESFLTSRSEIDAYFRIRNTHFQVPVNLFEIDASFQIPDNLSQLDAPFQKFQDNFFAGMKGLKLMDLSRISFSPVQVSSLAALVMLRTLCLDCCELSDISVIGELPRLQALSLRGSSIFLVPKEIQKLGNTLKLLDLRNCQNLMTIAAGVISKLTLLEDLRIGDSFSTWQRLEGGGTSSSSVDETEVASLEEFKKLQNLINLEINIPNYAEMFPQDLVFEKLETFRIVIESQSCWYNYLLPRVLVVDGGSQFDNEGIKALVTRAESLLLERVVSSVSVSEMDHKGFPELKHLEVNQGGGLQCIVKKNYNTCFFQKLETLKLHLLFNLDTISDDHDQPLPVGSFENLRVIELRKCELLNHLLSSNLARGLLHVEEINVSHCKSMESIIVSRKSDNEEEIEIGFTNQLRVLSLSKLPRLVSFCSFNQIEEVASPTPLFNKKIMFPNLEVLKLSYMKIEKIWDDRLAMTVEGTCWLQNLTSLEVSYCDSLSYLFTSSSTAKSLVNLKKMSVRKCDALEEIVVIYDQQQECVVFEKLEVLKLQYMESLSSFCSTSNCSFQFPSLNQVIVFACPNMKVFCGGDVSTPKLLCVKKCSPKISWRAKESLTRWEGDLNSTVRKIFHEPAMEGEEEEDLGEKVERQLRVQECFCELIGFFVSEMLPEVQSFLCSFVRSVLFRRQ